MYVFTDQADSYGLIHIIFSVIFSDDGKKFAILNNSQQQKIIIFNINENIISKECEVIVEFGQSLSTISRWNDDVCGKLKEYLYHSINLFLLVKYCVTSGRRIIEVIFPCT